MDGSGMSTVISGRDKPYAITIDNAENILYAGTFTSPAQIVRYDLDTASLVDDFNTGELIYDVTIIGDFLFYVIGDNGLKAVHKNGSSLLQLSVSGLQNCTHFFSIHAVNEATIEPTTMPTTVPTTEPTTEPTTVRTTKSMTETIEHTTTDPEITTQQIRTNNMKPTMIIQIAATGVQSISAFENVASMFPANSTPGILINNSDLVFYLFDQINREEDFHLDSEGDMAVTIPKEFLESGLYNGTGKFS
ncbi:uncharacterized protein [Amphiura filiformis]|uniref:uncharacterized protein n=1 Tax=Amphiura filiformis TaxID=82378 RepID=UPI003B218F97